MAYWLMKSEPTKYGWDDLVRDGGTDWDGVRNNAARLHLRAMKPGDEAFFYHSMADKAVVGTEVFTTAWTTGRFFTCWANAWPDPPNASNTAATMADALPAPKNVFNFFSNYGGRPSNSREG
jgi:predicted RNA-binding protein with PUA-like domain